MDRYVVIDLETTGHSPIKEDRIIEIGIVVIENNEIKDKQTTFINPNQSIPPFITNLTGITNEDVVSAPSFSEKAQAIVNIFKDSYLIAHNVPFDLGFLNAELENCGYKPLNNPVIDTVELSRILFPKATSYKLGDLAEFFDMQHNDPHRALSDAIVTAKLFIRLLDKLNALPYETIHYLLKMEPWYKSDLQELLLQCEHKSAFQTYENSDIDTFQGIAFKRFIEEQQEKEDIKELFGYYLDNIYEENGTLHQYMSKYEKRAGQREMSETIYDSFQTKNHALIEAETGTGKTLAYLIPTIYEAVTKKERIIISTYTTQLQSQLIDQEIPLIKKLLSHPFEVALLKGKSHYISLEKFKHELDHGINDNYDIILTKSMILVWLTETVTGDIDEINLPVSGYLFYKNVSTDAEGVVDPYSPWFSKSFYQRAKRRANNADIIITNHALLCTDIFNDYQLLPTYKKIIIDEAHHFEETASHHYGLKIDYKQVQYILNQIGHADELKLLGKIISNKTELDSKILPNNWDNILDQTKYEIDELFELIYQYVTKRTKSKKSLSDVGRTQYRFDQEQNEGNSTWLAIKEIVTRITFQIRELIHIVSMIGQSFIENENMDKFDKEDLDSIVRLLQEMMDQFEDMFLIERDFPQVKWIEVDTKGSRNDVYLYAEPIDISSLLKQDFFDKKESVILTSATLTINHSFSYIENRLGIPEDRLITQKIDSPFSYSDQVQVMIPSDFPDIKYGKMDDYIYATCEAILSLAEITDGRMLVLFTSYDMLKKTYLLLKEMIDIDKYVLIGQGITSGSRTRLKKNFQTFDQAILLGTSSFWEGVDIPGEDLSSLIIVRLPFQPPDHPVFEAKSHYYQQQGINAFMDYALPNAVIKFKQGFGRLIRASSDRGIVFICDARIKKTRYGKYFLQSIPEVPISFDTTKNLMDKAKEWF